MKRIPVSALLLLVTWWGIFFGLVFRKSGLPYQGDMSQASLFYIVNDHEEPDLHKAIDATPVWNFRDPNPPMGARTAIEFAERFKVKRLRPINNASWKIKSLAPYAIENADTKWCWAVLICSCSDDYPKNESELVNIYVMPNGEVCHLINNRLIKNSDSRFFK